MFLTTIGQHSELRPDEPIHSYIISFMFHSFTGRPIYGSDEVRLNRPLGAFDHEHIQNYIRQTNGLAPPLSKDITILGVSSLGVLSNALIIEGLKNHSR